MSLVLVALHDFAQNGALFGAQLAELTKRLPASVELVCPEAPHSCSDESVQRMAAANPRLDPKPPHLRWFEPSSDGATYQGWDLTREQLRELCDRPEPVVLLGFGQGATVVAALAALRAAGQFPPLAGAILIAGEKPRATALTPLFQAPVALPALIVWGERDPEAVKHSAELVEVFTPDSREASDWPGDHAIPTQGPAADAIVALVSRFA